jgi:ATP-binding cassette subfamily B protein
LSEVAAVSWPIQRAPEGLDLLAHAAGFPRRASHRPYEPEAGAQNLDASLMGQAAALGLEVEAVDASFGEIDSLLRSVGPAVIRIGNDAAVMLLRRRGRRLIVIGPDHREAAVPLAVLRRVLIEPEAAPLVAGAERLAEESGVLAANRSAVAQALIEERLRSRRLRGVWLLRIPTGASFGAQVVSAGGRRHLVLLAFAHASQYGLWIAAWWLLGRAALQGRLDASWLSAWTLALFTLVPLQLAALWLQGRVAISVGALLKQRLLSGAFELESEEIRREGAGHLLGRVIEAEAVESLALGGGFMALLAALELLIAACVLAVASPLLAILLIAWTAVAAALGWMFFHRRLGWVRLRIRLTLDLIEGMIGHRTRVAQQRTAEWHRGEDEALERYVHASSSMDRAAVSLLAIVPRGWILVGLFGLAPTFVSGERGGVSAPALAIALGGILLGFRAFHRLTAGVWSLAGAAIGWRQTAPIFHAATRRESKPGAAASRSGSKAESISGATDVVLDATELRFTHAGRDQPVLRGCTLSLAAGERVILQGPSGCGKSTLASLLAGLRTPQSGLLLADGLDRHTLGRDGWRRRVVLVPQFHENHLALGSIAFNLLMGAEWPATEADFARADSVLRELGLGDMLDRMPSGLLQTIGETGWQLSHGERSRIYLARALLQQPDVLVLDESFAQLDPHNMHLALDAVVSRGNAVLLIAHQ